MAPSAQDILNEVIEERELESETTTLAHGRTLRQTTRHDELTIFAPDGRVELAIRLTPAGPVLSFEQSNITLANQGNLKLECQSLEIKTNAESSFEIGGDLRQRVAGNFSLEARDDSSIKSQAIALEAELGELSLKANDDVAIDGLRVLVNVPTAEDLAEARRRAKTIEDRLELPFQDETSTGRLPRTPPKARDDF